MNQERPCKKCEVFLNLSYAVYKTMGRRFWIVLVLETLPLCKLQTLYSFWSSDEDSL